MSAGVFTPDHRIEWVNGWITGYTPPDSLNNYVEVGDGTLYPMEVTLDQIAEIFYRVKTAQVTEHTLSQTVAEYSIGSGPLLPRMQAAQADLAETGYQDYVIRHGYVMEDADPPYSEIPPSVIPYMGEEYTIDFTGYYSYSGIMKLRDIANNERGIWHPSWDTWKYSIGGFYSIESEFINAFSLFSQNGTYDVSFGSAAQSPLRTPLITSDNVNFGTLTCIASFTGKIAIVRENPNDGFFEPTNRFFIGFFFGAGTGGSWDKGTLKGYSGNNTLTNSFYKMKLANNVQIQVPLYLTDEYDPEYWQDEYFLHEAIEWWPYAKDSPAVPVWNTETGAKL